jgi:hypothetical protein
MASKITLKKQQQWTSFKGKFRGRKDLLGELEEEGHFGAGEGSKRPIETIFRQMVFKPLVFGTFGEMSSNVKELIEMVVEYGVEHMGKSMATTTVDIVR